MVSATMHVSCISQINCRVINRFVEVEALMTRKKEILSAWKRDKERDKPDPLNAASVPSPQRRPSSASLAMSDRKREINKQKLEKWQKEKEEEQRQKQVCASCTVSCSCSMFCWVKFLLYLIRHEKRGNKMKRKGAKKERYASSSRVN